MADNQIDQILPSYEEELSKAETLAQSADYWTLAQAAAWVMFRDMSIVARFTPPRAAQWCAYVFYPQYWTKFPVLDTEHDLFRMLGGGHLTANGRRSSDGVREPIPALNWADLVPDVDEGPYVSEASGRRVRPWTDILVSHSDIKRLWGPDPNSNGRSLYKETWIQRKYLDHLRDGKRKEKAIASVQVDYVDQFGGPEPSRSTIQRCIDNM